jgi:malate dehydrogenase (oxaloacetate-decarboxylating)(NADP+)
MAFGKEYLIPKPFDPRVLLWEAPAVAKAAMETGVAKKPLADMDAYRESLERILGPSRKVMHMVFHKVKKISSRRIAFPEGEDITVIRAARAIVDQKIARPILIGNPGVIREKAALSNLEPSEYEVVDIHDAARQQRYADEFFHLRERKGMTPRRAKALLEDPTLFGLMMVRHREADGFVGGKNEPYPETIRPAIQIVGIQDGVSRVAAVHLLVLRDRLFFFADTMVNIEPTPEELAEIARMAADAARFFDIEPRIAMLSFSSFGSVRHPQAERVARAVALLHRQRPDLVVDGEMHLDSAVVKQIVEENYPHSRICGDANVLIFPDLAAGNIGYKLVQYLGRADAIGPILMGMRRPVNVLQHGTTVADVVNVTAITAVAAEMIDSGTPAGASAAV